MKNIKPALSFFLFGIVTMLVFVHCSDREQNKPTQAQSKNVLDTAGINQRSRDNDSLKSADDKIRNAALMNLLAESISMGYNDKACNIYLDIARSHADAGNFDSTLHYYNLAKNYCNKPVYDKTLPAVYLTEFGAFYHGLQSDNVSANQRYYDALKYLEANDLTNNELTINIYLYLFATQEKLGNPEQGLKYLKDGEALAIKLNSMQALIAVRTNLGYYYSERKDYKTARTYFEKALENEEKIWNPIWDPNILIAALVGKASVLVKLDEASSAVPILQRAVKIAKDNNIVYSEVAASIDLGNAYNHLGKYNESIQLVSQSLKKQEAGFNWYREEAYRVLMEAYESTGQYKKALDYQRRLTAFNDSLSGKEKEVALNEMEVRFQTANKDKEITSQNLLIAQQRNKLSRKNYLILGISAGAIIIALILFTLFKSAANKQKLRELEIKTLQRQQEINMLRSTMMGEEQERQRLSRELHDGIGSMISSAIMQLSLLKKQHPDHAFPKEYAEVLRLLQETGSEVRKTAQNMMPDIINKQTLSQAVENYCESIAQGSSLKIDVQFYGDTEKLSSHCKLVVYRIIQELVHNVVKHANATHVIVQGIMNDGQFSVTVEDDGKGFDTNTGTKGMGLKNIASRVKQFNGDFQVESTPGKGTATYIQFECKDLEERGA